MTQEDGFLNRWSRRKLKPEESAPEEVQTEPVAGVPAEPEVPKTEEEVLEELGLCDPDELQPGDDFSGFMAKAVPERLRNRALRKLWLTNPILANLDELVDYGDDFTDAATVVENIQTIYRVGQGMIDRTVKPEPEPSAGDDEVADTEELQDEGETSDDAVAEAPEGEDPESEDMEADQPLSDDEYARIAELSEPLEQASFPLPRRMAFRFDEG